MAYSDADKLANSPFRFIDKRIEKGFRETFFPSPAAQADPNLGVIMRNVPNVVHATTLLDNLIGAVVGEGSFGENFANDPEAVRQLGYAQSGEQAAMEATGLGRADNIFELGLEVLGGNFPMGVVGAPAKGAMAIAKKVAPKAAEVVTKAGQTLPGKTAAVIGQAVTPAMQAKTVKGATAEVGAATLINDTIVGATDPEYDSLIEASLAQGERMRQSVGYDPYKEDPYYVAGGQSPTYQDAWSRIVQENIQDPDHVVMYNPEDDLIIMGATPEQDRPSKNLGKYAAAAVAIGVGLGTGTKALRQVMAQGAADQESLLSKGIPSPETGVKEGKLWEEMPPSTMLSGTDIALTQTVDQMHPLNKYVDKSVELGTMTADEANVVRRTINTTLRSPPLTAKVHDFFKTAEFPHDAFGEHVKANRSLEFLEKQFRSFTDKGEQAYVRDRLVAGTMHDSLPDGGSFGQYDKNQLFAMSQPGGNAKLDQYVDDMHDYLDSFLAHGEAKGFFSPEFVADKRINATNYMPLSRAGTEIKPLLERKNRLSPDQVGNPILNLRDYSYRVLREIELNEARRTFVDAFNTQKFDGHTMARKLRKGETADSRDITIKRDGLDETWRIGDPYIRHILEQNPTQSLPYIGATMNKIADVRRATQTGILAPLWATVKAPFYDLFLQAVRPAERTAAGGTTSGAAGAVLQALSDGKINWTKLDPSVVLNLHGAFDVMARDLSRVGAEQMRLSLANGQLTEILGSKAGTWVIEHMERAYLNSSRRSFERSGGVGGQYVRNLDSAEQLLGVQGSGMMGAVRSASGWNAFRGYVDAMHTGVRIAGFKNARLGLNIETVTIDGKSVPRISTASSPLSGQAHGIDEDLAAMFNASAGNVDRIPGVPATRGAVGSRAAIHGIPYLNPFIQSTARIFGKQTKVVNGKRQWDAAGQASSVAAFGGLLYGAVQYIQTQILGDPERAKKYLELSPLQRSTMLPLMNDDGEIMLTAGVDPALRPFFSAYIEGMLALQSFKNPSPEEQNEAIVIGLRRGFHSMYDDMAPDVVPPAFPLAVNLGGLGQMIEQDIVGSPGTDTQPMRIGGKSFDTEAPKRLDEYLEQASAINEAVFSGLADTFDATAAALGNSIYDQEDTIRPDTSVSDILSAPMREEKSPTHLLFDQDRVLEHKVSDYATRDSEYYNESIDSYQEWIDSTRTYAHNRTQIAGTDASVSTTVQSAGKGLFPEQVMPGTLGDMTPEEANFGNSLMQSQLGGEIQRVKERLSSITKDLAFIELQYPTDTVRKRYLHNALQRERINLHKEGAYYLSQLEQEARRSYDPEFTWAHKPDVGHGKPIQPMNRTLPTILWNAGQD